jgi:hypothetical protein
MVDNANAETVWEVSAVELQRVPADEGVFAAIPLAEAPPELLELFKKAKSAFDRQLAERGPRKALIEAVRYGVVPEGYKEHAPASRLVPGDYEISVFAEQGQGAARFHVPAA